MKKEKAELKVFWEITTMKEGEFYEDDNGRECQASPTYTKRISVEEKQMKGISKVFDEQDGDYDFSATILFITDMEGRILFDNRVKNVSYNDVWDRYCKYKDEQNPYKKLGFANDVFTAIQSEMEYRGKDRDRRQKDFIARMKYESQEDMYEEGDSDGRV